ncbi:E3 ubiquitin-protein ligase RMA1H1 [Ziziphus jujuba]|uniref:E3 ubiquitin-protein ligase RMA n=2 Tax=Ziziphus jujuba TaxID=326968 RepID=A0A6P3YVS8_ZIZJJ|nr:E3 ubiquitin-protein ligase RMA1H1 [Ziziphus jujuba]KAH7512539.1 hypothetical protein FEM48_Zijuj12G0101200 [Ziziphus jujuba var. spinosa]
MAMAQNFFEPEAHFELDGDVSLKQKWRSIPSSKKVSENDNGSFECNICLDSASDPVVTLCGHLYCWPCIYKWLQVQSSSDVEPDQKNCPVCKANISHASLIPLYGRGRSCSDSEAKKPNLDLVIPRRPPPGLNTIITSTTSTSHPNQQLHPNYFQSQSQSFHHPYFPHSYGAYAANMSSSNLGGASILFNPTIVMFGELVFSRMFGSSDTNLFPHPPMNSYPSTGSGSPRMRRHEMQFDKSLNRVSIFLFCCLILCLLSF